jgi:uncharacterized protein YceH (UPF0502 family)
MNSPAVPVLSPLETRVLGVLVEKQLTTPDYYPLSLNALVAGCNQKTSRDPVMNASDAEVQTALDELKEKSLVSHSWGSSRRVVRYAHNLPTGLRTDPGTTALLAVLMLRGPQTNGELRIACERLYRFADLSAVEGYLEEMANRPIGALVVKLPKQPGSREHRWAHLLNGPIDIESFASSDSGVTGIAPIAALAEDVAQLRDEVSHLRAQVEKLFEELGVKRE